MCDPEYLLSVTQSTFKCDPEYLSSQRFKIIEHIRDTSKHA